MAVTKEIKRLEKSNLQMSFTVPKDDVRARYQEMLKDYTKNLQIPGFRKGKVPQEVLERKFADALKQDALGRIIESALEDAFKNETLSRSERPLPYSVPELQGEPKLDFEQDLQFSVIYDVLPEVKINQWKGLTVEFPYAVVEKEDIDRELEGIRERNAIVMDRDDGAAAQKGDVATVDYAMLNENGEPMTEFQRKDFVFTIGSGHSVFQFDDDIPGMKKGETREFDKIFPDDFFERAIAGQTRKMRLTLTALKEKKLPDLDDDLAQDVDEKYKTLGDLKNSIRERLNKSLENRLRELKLNELLKKIMENTPVLIPESMIRAEVESRWRRLARYYNTSVESMMQLMASEDEREEKEKEWRATSEKALHSRLIIETLIEEHKFEVTDADVEKEMERLALENDMEIDDVKKRYQEEKDVFYLKEGIKERQVIDILLAENTLKQGKKENYLDVMSDND
ncbi:MAG: trigger factor [Treponema sp.]|nr:trigger factor [Treponema sp.]